MYSYEERLSAVKQYIQFNYQTSLTIRHLGYPKSRHTLRTWYLEYEKNQDLKTKSKRKKKYSEQQKKEALKYYFEHGEILSKTVETLGYPSKDD